MRDVIIYRVTNRIHDSVEFEEVTDLESLIELGPGEYVAKPPDGEGCWLDAVSFVVVPQRLWEGLDPYLPLTPKEVVDAG